MIFLFNRVLINFIKSSGKTDNLEAFDLKNSNARYVRYNGKGNSANLWNSVSEFKLYAPSETGEMLLDINQGILAGTEDVLVNGELMEKTPFEKEIPNVSWVNLETVGGYYFPNKGILNVKKTDTNPGFLEMWLPHGEMCIRYRNVDVNII